MGCSRRDGEEIGNRAAPGCTSAERYRWDGFTLIEMMAVVAIMALLIGLVAPNVGRLTGGQLRNEAETLAARLELARQRSVMTAIPHRIRIDLDAASYQLEWLVSDADATGEAPAPEPLDPGGSSPLPLAAPRAAEGSYRPLPGLLGKSTRLPAPLLFRGLETPTGWVERGEAFIEFERDGTASWTQVYLVDDSGHDVVVDVLPLADAVKVSDAAG